MKVKYILAILNSRIAQLIYKKQFNSVKVLRSHIESIPIPVVPTNIQTEIIKCTEPLIAGCELDKAEKYYDILDAKISKIYGLTNTEVEIIKAAVDNENKFLA